MTIGAAASPLNLIRQKAPAFNLPAVVNGQIKSMSSQELNGKMYVLFFYPLDFTFVCPTEIIAFSDRVEEFRQIGVEVLAASVDSEHSHLAWTQKSRADGGLGDMKIPLLADLKRELSHAYGVLLPDAGHTLRGLFIVDKKGIVRHATLNDTPIGRNVDEALRLCQAIQFAEEHGEVCPINWKPGQKTMKADPVASKSYFAATYKA